MKESFYKTTQVTENVYQIRGLDATNVQLVIGREQALLFDTSYGYGNLRREVEKLTDLPLIVVNSHLHLDHINGNYRFDGPCYISGRMADRIPSECNETVRQGIMERGIKDYGAETVLSDGQSEADFIHARMPEFSYLREGDSFDLGGITMNVVELPGHTKDEIGLWQADTGLLLAGDAFGPFTWIFGMTAGTLTDYRGTLQKAVDLKPSVICNGHSEAPFGLKELYTYMEMAEQADFEEGRIWKPVIQFPDLEEDNEIRILTRKGFKPFDFRTDGFASMAIGRKNFI